MNASEPKPLDEPKRPAEQYTCNLNPLRDDGPDSLTPAASDGFSDVRLTELELSWPNAFNMSLTERADDLFRCAAAEEHTFLPIPPGATLTHAVLAFKFRESTQSHKADIRPPSTLRLEFPEDAPRIIPFLARHHILTLML